MDLASKKLQIIEKVMGISDAKNLVQIEALLDSSNHSELSIDEKFLLDQRLTSHKNYPDSGKDWKMLKKELSKKYGSLNYCQA